MLSLQLHAICWANFMVFCSTIRLVLLVKMITENIIRRRSYSFQRSLNLIITTKGQYHIYLLPNLLALPSLNHGLTHHHQLITPHHLRAPLVQMVARFVRSREATSSKFSSLLVYFVPPNITHRSIPCARACLVARFASFVELHLGREVKYVRTVRPIYGNRLLFRRS